MLKVEELFIDENATVNLPCSTDLTEEACQRVIDAVLAL